MADLFERTDAVRVLKDKSVLFLGDSIMRNIYKDFITLVDPGSRNRLTTVSNDMPIIVRLCILCICQEVLELNQF